MALARNAVCKTPDEPREERGFTLKERSAENANRRQETVSAATLEAMRAAIESPPPPTPELVELLAKRRRSRAGQSRR